jgi:hypothetical protein
MAFELTIVVPAFNEAHRLAEGMKRFDAAVGDGAVDLQRTEVLVIDDGSTDDTAATARALLAHIPHHRVVSLPSNQGKGAAVRAGVTLARGTFTAYMDADMAIDPRSIPLLVNGLHATDLVIGSRALPDSMVESTYAVRSVMGQLFNRLVTTGTGMAFQDTQCGFKAFRTPAARLLFHVVPIKRFAFDVEILARAQRLGLAVSEIPVQWRHVPGSTVHPLHDSVTMLSDIYRARLGLVASPPVPGVLVRPPGRGGADRVGPTAGGRTVDPSVDPSADPGPDLTRRVHQVVSSSYGGRPLPVIRRDASVIVLLPLVEAEDAAVILTALRAEFGQRSVTTRSLTASALAALGPLSGRLDADLDADLDGGPDHYPDARD